MRVLMCGLMCAVKRGLTAFLSVHVIVFPACSQHRKLQPPRFVPSSMKKLMVNGIFGTQVSRYYTCTEYTYVE